MQSTYTLTKCLKQTDGLSPSSLSTCSITKLPTNSENIQLAADHKRSEAKRKLSQIFRISEGYASTGAEELVDDIIAATILEISAIRAKASEPNVERRQPEGEKNL